MSTRKSLLVIGGCGYIGSHMVSCLIDAGHQVTVLDDLSTGFSDSLLGGELIVGNFGCRETLDAIFSKSKYDGVLHFASLIQVGESVAQPATYYQNNVANTLTLLSAMVDHKVGPLVFSSTAAVFGEPSYVPIDEVHPRQPMNPYGMSKYMVEAMLQDFDSAYGLRSVSLRYFNAAGADPQGRIGERHNPETHLIPLALRALLDESSNFKVFGDDYDTPDGTCIRDYVHVADLAEAHLCALNYLWQGGATSAFNLGSGSGFSVREILDTIRTVVGKPVRVETVSRRAGDPARLVADSALAMTQLGWTPKYSSLETIVRHAWQWEQVRHRK
ncbi:MAG: UDP-glucose 4-epimerase GalE [Rhodocyclaceae bacterium]|nr:UDP-glucose 4-epimerase GalE [Rhodocyclaceae bacterium]